MKKALVLFAVFFVITMVVPMFIAFQQGETNDEMIKMLHSAVIELSFILVILHSTDVSRAEAAK